MRREGVMYQTFREFYFLTHRFAPVRRLQGGWYFYTPAGIKAQIGTQGIWGQHAD